MQRKNREVTIFNLSMLDVMTGALGAVMIIMIVLLTQKIGAEEDKSPTKLTKNADSLTKNAQELTQKAIELKKQDKDNKEEAEKLIKKANELSQKALKLTQKAIEITKQKLFLKKWEEELKKREEAVKKKEQELKVKPQKVVEGGGKVGFKIPKKVVLMIDLSGSMVENPDHENRMDQVRAGLKMMIATMSNKSKVDIVFFPAFANLKKTPQCQALYTPPQECKTMKKHIAYKKEDINCYKYGTFNGKLVSLDNDNIKYDFYKKISCLEANWNTPTIPALKYVLKNYKDAEGIILYSDGTPDALKNGKTVDELVNEIKALNTDNKKIYTIGVGSEFRENKNTPAVNFLKKLAKENNGHFVGF